MSAPFLTITKARDVVRTVSANMTQDIHVYLRGADLQRHQHDHVRTAGLGDQRAPDLLRSLSRRDADPERRDQGHRMDAIQRQRLPGPAEPHDEAAQSLRERRPGGDDQQDRHVARRDRDVRRHVRTGQLGLGERQQQRRREVQHADVPAIASNKDDLEIINGTTWNENIVCVRDVVTTSDNFRGLLFQQPYGAIAQLPGWNAGFSVSGTHTIYNAFEFLNAPGQFYFDKTTGTLYYYPRSGENMATADVQAPVVEKLIDIAGTSNTNRVKNLTFQGITFQNTDYNLYTVASSRGKAIRAGRDHLHRLRRRQLAQQQVSRSPTRCPG